MPNSRGPHVRNPLRLQLLGGAALLGPDGAPIGQQRRRLALLALVTAAGDSGVTRDRLMAVLSPDSPIESARHALHQLLYYIRQQAGDDLFVGTDPLSLNSAVLASDHREFDAACDRQAFASAVALYQGPFLDGFHLGDSSEFEDWAAVERARLAARFTDALFHLAREADAAGEHHRAIDWWRRLVVLDPLDGRAAIGLTNALVAGGDTPGAVRHARAHAALVQHELGREPDPRVTEFLAVHPREARIAGPSIPPAVDAAPAVGTGPAAGLRPATRTFLALGLTGLLLVLGLPYLRPSETPRDAIGRIAVLPVVNGSNDTTVAQITEALTQELIAALSRTGLRVIGYYSVEKYRGSRPPVAEIGRDLRVDAVATWTVLREQERWRVSLEVSRATSGEGLWSSTEYVVDSLRLADVPEGAARELASRFAPTGRKLPERTAAINGGAPEARLAFLLGLDRMYRGSEAVAYIQAQFERAIALDSSFAPGFAGLASSLLQSIDYGQLPVREACAAARPAIQRALALDPELAFAHLARARLLQHCDWSWTEADAEYRRAIALEPTATFYHHYGWYLSWYLGRFSEGVELADTALSLEPTSPMQHMALAWRLTVAGELERAEEEARAGLALESQILDGHWILAEVALMRGDLETAEREALLLKSHPEAVPANYSMLGEIYGRTGRIDQARAYLGELAASSPMTGAGRIAVARTQMAIGERDAALTTLERAVDDGVFIIPHMPYWGPLRDHPRFQSMMRRMGL